MKKTFKIIATPPGQAPEWVRKEWVGVELPMSESGPGHQHGVLGGQPENIGGYKTNGLTAVNLLNAKSPKAAEWWHKNAPHVLSAELVFKKEVCVEITQ